MKKKALKRIFRTVVSLGLSTMLTISACANENQLTMIHAKEMHEEFAVYGDINWDGKVDREDAQIVLAHAASMLPFDVTQVYISDVNGDGKVTAADASLITQYSLMLITGFPVEGESPYLSEKIPEVSLSVSGQTLYIDTEGEWTSCEGQITFDSSDARIVDYRVSEDLQLAALKQHKEGSYEHLAEGDNYYFAASYLGADGTGIKYSGHAAALTVDVLTPCTVTLTMMKDGKEITISENLESSYVLPCNSPPPSIKFPYGDVDEDGSITAADALLVLKSVVSLQTLTTDQQTRADVDWDASITAADALLILKRVVNLIARFPAEGYV